MITPPRRGVHGPGGRQAPEPQSPQEGHEQYLRFLRMSGQGTSGRTDGMTLGRLETCWWTRLLGCNRTWQISELKTGCCEHRWQATFTTTNVPRFGGMTSWEQYRQVFDMIVLSNGWDDATAALQLFSHLEGDALNVALLVPMARQMSRTGLVDALSAHYGSPGRLADYGRQFEKNN